MRIVLVVALLTLCACGGHGAAVATCTLGLGETPTPRTGEHSLAVTSSCPLTAVPRVELLGLHGKRLAFTYVSEGGPKGTHTVLLDKYRCDIRYRDLGHEVVLGGRRLGIGRSLMDWCPAQAVSTVVRVYLGGRHSPPTWRGVLRDAYDGRLDRVWSCGALRSALAHLSVSTMNYSPLSGLLGRAAAHACRTAIASVPRGAPRWAVLEALGTPAPGGARCAVWGWPPASGSVDGARICFEAGRAVLVQTAVHG